MSRSNLKTGLSLAALVCGMIMLSYASVPLYRLFCQVTGFGGTPMISTEAVNFKPADGYVKVFFNSDTSSDLNWKFTPDVREIPVQLGVNKLAFYVAENTGSSKSSGIATYNVTPEKAAPYFHKVYCFCFEEQSLKPGERMDMPVSFYIDPKIAEDPNTKDIKNITLSYTFFKPKSNVSAE